MILGIAQFEVLQALLLIVSIVVMITSKLRLPYSVGLVLIGGILAFVPVFASIPMTSSLIYKILLPPLIFEAALFLPQRALLKESPLIFTLATLGVVIATIVVTLGLHGLLAWPWMSAAIFGALISATDPISVISIFKDSDVNSRLKLLVESESLFNDATAAVLFTVLVGVSQGDSFSMTSMFGTFILMSIGSILCGIAISAFILWMMRNTHDHLVELAFTTVAAYGSFLLADDFHLSGVLATLTAGLIMGNKTFFNLITEKGRLAISTLWEYLAFIANSFVFLLIGIREVQQPFKALWLSALIAIIVVFIGRVISIYPIGFVFSRSALRISRPYQHILTWGGLRGALALALALGLPDNLPYRDEITSIAFMVVAFSIIVQGLTIKPLLKFLGETRSQVA